MEVEQTHLIKFFVKEGMKWVEIIDRLNKHYGRDPLQRTQACYWIKEVKSGRKDLSNVLQPGRASDEGLDDSIGKALIKSPPLSTRKIAQTLNTGFRTMQNHLTKFFWDEMLPYAIGPHVHGGTKRKKQGDSQTPATNAGKPCSIQFPHHVECDASWIFYESHHETIWAVSWLEVNRLEWRTHHHRNTIATAFFNHSAEYFLNPLPRSRSMGTSDSAGEMISGLEDVRYPEGRNLH
jgi:hypothetical protein